SLQKTSTVLPFVSVPARLVAALAKTTYRPSSLIAPGVPMMKLGPSGDPTSTRWFDGVQDPPTGTPFAMHRSRTYRRSCTNVLLPAVKKTYRPLAEICGGNSVGRPTDVCSWFDGVHPGTCPPAAMQVSRTQRSVLPVQSPARHADLKATKRPLAEMPRASDDTLLLEPSTATAAVRCLPCCSSDRRTKTRPLDSATLRASITGAPSTGISAPVSSFGVP